MKKYKVTASYLVEGLREVIYEVEAESFEDAKERGYELAEDSGKIWVEVDSVEDVETGETFEYGYNL